MVGGEDGGVYVCAWGEEDVSICEGEIIWINLTAINRRRVADESGDGDDVCEFQNLYTRFSEIKRRRRCFYPYIFPSSLFISLSIHASLCLCICL